MERLTEKVNGEYAYIIPNHGNHSVQSLDECYREVGKKGLEKLGKYEDNVERTIREFNEFLPCVHDKRTVNYAFGVLNWIKYFLSFEEFETLRDNLLKRTEEMK